MDPAIVAALIAGGVAVALAGGRGLLALRTRRNDAKRAAQQLRRNERKQVIDSLISAGSSSLLALDDDGDLGGAEFEAEQELSRAEAGARRLGDSDITAIADEMRTAVRQRDRAALRAALATLQAAH